MNIEDLPCHGQYELFFPKFAHRKGPEFHARRICRECPLQELCLARAIANDEALTRHGSEEHGQPAGVWGGATRPMLRKLTVRSRRGRVAIPCTRCEDGTVDHILAANTDELVCATCADDLPWK